MIAPRPGLAVAEGMLIGAAIGRRRNQRQQQQQQQTELERELRAQDRELAYYRAQAQAQQNIQNQVQYPQNYSENYPQNYPQNNPQNVLTPPRTYQQPFPEVQISTSPPPYSSEPALVETKPKVSVSSGRTYQTYVQEPQPIPPKKQTGCCTIM